MNAQLRGRTRFFRRPDERCDGHLMSPPQVFDQVKGADLRAVIGWERKPVGQEQDLHGSAVAAGAIVLRAWSGRGAMWSDLT